MWSPSRGLPALVLLLLAGCGYHFPGGGALPAGMERIRLAVEPENTELAQALEDRLAQDPKVTLVTGGERADGRLTVTGGEPQSRSAAIGPEGVATEYEVVLDADYRLVKANGSEQVLRSAQGLTVTRTYPYRPDGSPVEAEQNQRRAAREAAGALAQRILQSAKSGF